MYGLRRQALSFSAPAPHICRQQEIPSRITCTCTHRRKIPPWHQSRRIALSPAINRPVSEDFGEFRRAGRSELPLRKAPLMLSSFPHSPSWILAYNRLNWEMCCTYSICTNGVDSTARLSCSEMGIHRARSRLRLHVDRGAPLAWVVPT